MRVWEQSYQRRPGPHSVASGVSTSARLVDRYRIEPDQVSTMGTGEALVVIKSPPRERARSPRIAAAQPPAPGVTR